jgi:hypothetical protein
MVATRYDRLAGRPDHSRSEPAPAGGLAQPLPGLSDPNLPAQGQSMAPPTKTSLFKPGMPGRDKAETTTSIARAIAESEVNAREAKTARLKKLRLQKEAADEAAAAAAGPVAPKPTKAKRAAKV